MNLSRFQGSWTLAFGLAALASGGIATWLGNASLAQTNWIVGTLPAMLQLFHDLTPSLLRRELGLDLLALASIGGALALGENLTAVVIAVMLASGRALEDYAQQRAGQEMSALLGRVPRTARRLRDGAAEDVPLNAIQPGDRLLVRSGDVVPVDGMLATAQATLDESTLTGESVPVARSSGEAVRSSAVNAGNPFKWCARVHQLAMRAEDTAPTASTAPELRRLLYGLDAIVRLHLAQEEELYEGLA